MKKTLLLIGAAILALLLVAVLFHPFGLFAQRQTATVETVDVTTGSLAATINATGTIDPIARVNLSFDAGGRVAEILVELGQQVEKGQILARVDADELGLALRQAEAGLQVAEARLALTRKGSSASDIAAAEASLASAEAALDQALRGPTSDQTATARATLERARANLQVAQSAYDRVAWMPNIGMMPQSLQLQQATIDYDAAQATHRLATEGTTESAKRSAEAAVAQARAQLERLKNVPAAEDVTVAEATVEQSRISVEQAQRRVRAAELLAPFSGAVEDINLKVGQTVSALAPVLVLIDMSAWEVNVDVDETDVRQLAPGQAATITLDALPSATLSGRVTRVSPGATLQNGVVAYVARVALETSEPQLRPGMSANVAIVVASRENVVIVSNRGIQIDRDTGERFVLKQTGGGTEVVWVSTGIRDDYYTEILSGLQPGDRVAILSAAEASAAALRSSIRGGQ